MGAEVETWRDRLAAAIKRSGKSMRAVSISAGNAPGYVHSVLKGGKDPTIDNLLSVCREADVSLLRVLYGFDVTPETEEVLRLLELRPGARSGILQILREESAP